ncbi:Taurine dioxygenase, alpha-ketoglutarate-dependent [Ruegeria marina]|uniref:Taurine dioxygenase, alpha-ketoglutarate-dependent n=2 Tax=Ruegeria marina TaxID=639004 RepID=A0A1G6S6R7_9RHOB|nr:Taurine dioxygenase, alpha-ketoglutarate-dependent [Ruegeria marina]
MENLTNTIRNFDWTDLSQNDRWENWRTAKIRVSQTLEQIEPVSIAALDKPDPQAVAAIEWRCSVQNFAIYRTGNHDPRLEYTSASLLRFAGQLGLSIAENHRSAGLSHVVALRTSSGEGKKGYIPYTPRPMNWHTDGYYNPPEQPVKGFILHCFQQALSGGENHLLDPEVAYLRLRDENPDYVRALMHPEAMTIPENREKDGTLRPTSTGPVFHSDEATGRLQMRYTARTRSIAWRDDPATRAAADWLRDWLGSGDPLMRSIRLQPGQGIVCNNVLHDRTGFTDGEGEQARVILRIRFHQRVREDFRGAA